MMSKAKRFEKEQTVLVSKIVDILNLQETPVHELYDMDRDSHMQDQIMELSPDIESYFNCNNLKAVTDPSRIKRPWLSIIKTLLKHDYQIIVDDFNKKVNTEFVHTKKYTFIRVVV